MQPYFGSIPSYSIFASAGLFVMMLVLYFRCVNLEFRNFLALIFLMVLGAAVGSKCLFIITKIPEMFIEPTFKNISRVIVTGGFVFYGGLFGAVIGAFLFAKLFAQNMKILLDLLSAGFAAFHIFGRIGCFFAGCCYGKEANWGFSMADEPEILRIPIQLIESLCLTGILSVILMKEKYLKTKEYSFVIYLGLYALCRFGIEFFRGDSVRGFWGVFSVSQWISLCILLGILLNIIKNAKFRTI